MLEQSQIARPEDLGIDPEKLEAVFARAARDIEQGILPSAQVAVARKGRLAGMRTFGSAVQGGEERAATNDTLYHFFSPTKGIVSVAVWLLFEEGKLRLDDRIAQIIPEFGTNGKDTVTVEQAMLHAGGFPYAPFPPRNWGDREALIDAFKMWRLTWPVDSRFEYHPTSMHWVLSEMIHRLSGRDYKTFISDRLLKPMGLDHDLYIGCPVAEQHRVADVLYVAEPVEPPQGWGEVTPEFILRFNEPAQRAAGAPGAGACATAAAMALFYQPLVNGGVTADGTRIINQDTIDFATTVRSRGHHIDQTAKYFLPDVDVNVNRALGVSVAGGDGYAYMRGFGRTCSGCAFGHGGAGGQIAWGDPETGISVGYATNGFTDTLNLGRRVTAIGSLAGDCLL